MKYFLLNGLNIYHKKHIDKSHFSIYFELFLKCSFFVYNNQKREPSNTL